MFVLIQQHGAHSAFGARDALDHGKHHPSHSRVLAKHFKSLVGLTEYDHFIDHAPFVHAQRARQIELSFGYAGDHLGHAGDKKYRHRKTSRYSLSVCPVLAIRVKKNVRPSMEIKRSLLSKVTIGRKNGMTVR